VIKEFLGAIKRAVSKRNISARTVIVRSDGSLMSDEFASVRPVETLLCGPAASVAGGIWLSGEKDCVIVDMGGTTTDIALVKDGIPVKVTDGVSVGKWKTFVHGFYIKTFGLGGDSAVHYNEKGLYLEDHRVIPLCVAAVKYPQIIKNLKNLVETYAAHSFFLHEHYILVNEIKDKDRYTKTEKRFCEALKNGPLILKDAASALDEDIYNLNVSRLLKEGVVQLCGLTPTDIMHIKNDFSVYSREASLWGAKYAAFNLGISVEELCDKVYDEVKRKLYVNIVKILLENQTGKIGKYYRTHGIDSEAERFITQGYEYAKRGGREKLLTLNFKTDFPLVGIGAPIHVFLKSVAELLETRAVVPEHSGVANALGAVVGNIYVSCTVEIRPNYTPGGITGYTVFGYNKSGEFKTEREAEIFAVEEAKAGARAEADKRGASGEINIDWTMNKSEAAAKDGMIYLGASVTANAASALDV
jgi:N-methylhydantoinase A/oxoprolinase/acetone carboxylase beta subunit